MYVVLGLLVPPTESSYEFRCALFAEEANAGWSVFMEREKRGRKRRRETSREVLFRSRWSSFVG
jgi:hypothetical protein